MRLRATEEAENSPRSALQLTQSSALSGDEALHMEQVCIEVLLIFLGTRIGSYFTALDRENAGAQPAFSQ
jgi:hypothetical protein